MFIEPLIVGNCKVKLHNNIGLVRALITRGYNLVDDEELFYYGAILTDEPYVVIDTPMISGTREHFDKIDLPEVNYEFLKHVYTTTP